MKKVNFLSVLILLKLLIPFCVFFIFQTISFFGRSSTIMLLALFDLQHEQHVTIVVVFPESETGPLHPTDDSL